MQLFPVWIPAFDLMTPNVDHWAVRLECHVVFCRGATGTGRLKRRRFDRAKILSHERSTSTATDRIASAAT